MNHIALVKVISTNKKNKRMKNKKTQLKNKQILTVISNL